jgi:hypothetical protein
VPEKLTRFLGNLKRHRNLVLTFGIPRPGARVCDPQQRDLQAIIRMIEPLLLAKPLPVTDPRSAEKKPPILSG